MTSAFFIDLHSIECTLFHSVQVYKKADVIYERPLKHRKLIYEILGHLSAKLIIELMIQGPSKG